MKAFANATNAFTALLRPLEDHGAFLAIRGEAYIGGCGNGAPEGACKGLLVGLYQMRMRYHDPVAGRFVSTDPLGLWADASQAGLGQGYCGHDPVNGRDPLGLYNMEWDESVSEAHKQEIRAAFARVDGILATRITEIEAEIRAVQAVRPCEDLVAKLTRLRDLLAAMRAEIASTTHNLEVSVKQLGTEVAATFWDGENTVHDDELTIDSDFFFAERTAEEEAKRVRAARGQPVAPLTDAQKEAERGRIEAKQNEDLFHELTHGQGTVDEGDFWNNAHNLERLASAHLTDLSGYNNEKRKALSPPTSPAPQGSSGGQ